MIEAFSAVVPVFLLIGLGVCLDLFRALPENANQTLSLYVLNVALPLLLFLYPLAITLILLALFFLFRGGFSHNVSMIALPIWMGYTAFNAIKSIADLIGAQNRTRNFTNMLRRWEDTFEGRGKALVLLTVMTLVVGLIKVAVPFLIMYLANGFG